MTNVFISYSRKDTTFARRLYDALTAQERSTWADWEGIPYSVDFWREIQQGIDAAEVFAFIISPDSLVSMVCNQEIAHARRNNKRIVPIMHRAIDEKVIAGEWFGKEWEDTARENWSELKRLNWLFFREADDFDKSFASLLQTIDLDPELVRFHTRMLVKAREWEAVRDRDHGQLLRGEELQAAEAWLKFQADKPPKPTELHLEYIGASIAQRKREMIVEAKRQQRLRILTVVLSVLLVFAVIAAVIAAVQTHNAEINAAAAVANADLAATNEAQALANEATAVRRALESRSLALAANAQVAAEIDDQLALGLAVEANAISDPPPLAQAALSRFAYRGGQLIAKLDPDPAARDAVRTIAYSSDGTKLALGTDSGLVTLWNGETLVRTAALSSFDGQIWALEFDPDGSRLAIGYGGEGDLTIVTLMDDSRLSLTGNTSQIRAIDFTPDGLTVIATSYNGIVRAWNALTGEEIWGHNIDDNTVFTAQNATGVLHPDGTRYFVTSTFNYQLLVLDAATGVEVDRIILEPDGNEVTIGSGCSEIALHPNGEQLLCVGEPFDEPLLILVDLDSGETRVEYALDISVLARPAFSNDGSRFVTADFTTLTLWDTERGERLHNYVLANRSFSPMISPDGSRVLGDLEDGAGVWDASLTSGAIDHTLPASDYWFSYEPKRGVLYITDNDTNHVMVVDETDGGIIATFPVAESQLEFIGVVSALPDGVLINTHDVTSSQEFLMRWNTDAMHDGGEAAWKIALGSRSVFTLNVSEDGSRAVLDTTEDDPPVIIDTETGIILREFDDAPYGLDSPYITPDGQRVGAIGCYAQEGTRCTDSRFDVWDANTGRLSFSVPGLIGGVAISPDGTLWAVADREGVITLIDAGDGSILRRLFGHTGQVFALAFNADTTLLISGGFSNDQSIRVWDVRSGDLLRQIEVGASVWKLAFSASGDRFFSLDQVSLTSNERTLRRWRLDESIQALLTWTQDNRVWRAFTCGERTRYGIEPFCAEGDNPAAIAALPTATPFPTVALNPSRTPLPRSATPTVTATPTITPTPTPAPYAYQALYGVRWSPDGMRLLAGELTGFVVVWDVASRTELYRLEGHDSDASVNGPRGVWSPDGARIATYSAQNTARIWDAETGTLIYTLAGHSDHVGFADWSPDGLRLVTASDDGTARIWDAQTGEEIALLEGHGSPVGYARFSPDGTQIATAGDDGTARVWDASTGQQQWLFAERDQPAIDTMFRQFARAVTVTNVIWSPDGSRLIATGSDGAAIIWDTQTGERLTTLRVPGERGILGQLSYFVNDAQWSPDGQQIVLNVVGGPPTVWTVSTEQLLFALNGHTDLSLPPRWSVDGTQLITSGYDGTIRIWDATNGQQVRLMDHRATLYWAAWSPDGSQIASVADNGTVRLWDAASGSELPFVAEVPATQVVQPQVTLFLTEAAATSLPMQQQLAEAMPTFGVALTASALEALAVTPAPTQIRSQPDADGVLFTEDFSDNTVSWETDGGTAPGIFSNVRDGTYVIDVDNSSTWFVAAGFNAPQLAPMFNSPYEMEFELGAIETDNEVLGVMVVFNVRPGTSGYTSFTGITAHENGRVIYIKDFALIGELEGKKFSLYRDRANLIRLRVSESSYRMYINDVLIVEIPADELIEGTVGFGFGNSFVAGEYYAEVDNLVVQVLPESGL